MLLGKEFDLVWRPYYNKKEMRKIPLEVFLRAQCWKLTLFKTCIYIDANHLVMKNIDHLFDENILGRTSFEKSGQPVFFIFHPKNKIYENVVAVFKILKTLKTGGYIIINNNAWCIISHINQKHN